MDKDTGVEGIIKRGNRFLILVKPNGAFNFPGGRAEEGESITDVLHR